MTFVASLATLTWPFPSPRHSSKLFDKNTAQDSIKDKTTETWILLDLDIYKELWVSNMREKEMLNLNRRENPRFKSEKWAQETLRVFCRNGDAECQLFHPRLSTPSPPSSRFKMDGFLNSVSVFIVILHKL
uniref:Uncharacterized protein n=1 Tax=Myotis myotis TaxID=51298 RepID=A0A7J7XHM0_MYOMY|nr:hypothetical protein mMyoMyo1_011678 [Myotis myotis]